MRLPTACLAAALSGLTLLACSEQAVEEPSAEAVPPPDASAEALGGVPAELEGNLPPVDPLALEPLYGDDLAALGVELTDRGGLIDRSDGYQGSADGTHLALYVAPTGERTDDEYVDGIVELAQLFLPEVFDRWPGLESFDVCQELPPDGETDYVTTVSQIDISREAAESVSWPDADPAELFVLDMVRNDASVNVFGGLGGHPRVQEARSEATSRIDERRP